jgi:hypothetical protein
MAAATKTVTCNFIGDFKVGDNMLANAEALCRLSSQNEKGVFNKLIVVQAGSIVEAALDQIIYRAQNYTKEGGSEYSGGNVEEDSEYKDRAVQQHPSSNEKAWVTGWARRRYL